MGRVKAGVCLEKKSPTFDQGKSVYSHPMQGGKNVPLCLLSHLLTHQGHRCMKCLLDCWFLTDTKKFRKVRGEAGF